MTLKFWQALAFVELDQAVGLAQASDEAGFEGVMVSDHLVFPEQLASPYPYSKDGAPPFTADTAWPDPWVLIGAMAAATTRLRFSTNIYVAGARDVLSVAKAVSTAAVVSGGRVALGVGAGWMREEFDLTGQPFARRGARLDEMITVMRALWSGETVEHHGEFYDLPPVRMTPPPPMAVPIWIGGQSEAAMARVLRNDGWIGNAYPLDEAVRRVEHVRRAREESGGSLDGFDIICAIYALDMDSYRRLEEAGATGVLTAPWMLAADASAATRLDAVGRFGDDVIGPMSAGG